MNPLRGIRLLAAYGLALCSLSATAITQAELDARLDARWRGDRTGACVVAAVVEGEVVTRGRTCAQPRSDGGPGYDAAFEIGSVTKTMTAFLVADLVESGRWSLDDPLARRLPEASVLPRQGERQILLRDLLTHSSGLPALPSRMAPMQASNPYAQLSERELLDSMADVRLSRPIGSDVEYSNFGMMLVSLAVSRALGGDLQAALKDKLFAPLGMAGAHISSAPKGQPQALGHAPNGQLVPAWTAATNLAGVGMVRAGLQDMALYAAAMAGARPGPWAARMRLTQQALAHGFGMNWMRRQVKGHELVLHEGATGGFSSIVVLEPAHGRAVVVLADTALAELGGLGDLGLSLLGVDVPLGKPRRATPAPASLLSALPGEYLLNGMTVRIRAEEGRLLMQAQGQPVFELHHDDHGDLYPAEFGALLTPRRESGRIDGFVWRQGGAVLEGRRQGADVSAGALRPEWRDWLGEYELALGFRLRVFEEGGRLRVQATGQPSIEASAKEVDRLEISVVGAVVTFKRDAQGVVRAAQLQQGGQTLSGPKMP